MRTHEVSPLMQERGTRRRFSSEVEATAANVRLLRASFAEWLADLGLDRAIAGELVLVMSELLTTCARPDRAQPNGSRIGARAWTERSTVVIEVASEPRAPLERVDDFEDATAGRGLSLVASLTNVLTVSDRQGTRVVRVRRDVGTERSVTAAR